MNEDAAKTIQEFEEIIKNKKSDIVWFKIFQIFKEKESFVNMVLNLNMSKLTIIFQSALKKLIDDYPKRLVAVFLLFFKKFEIDKRNMQRKH